MPKRTDIDSILIIGAGPIVIGQACEFDYSGTQACKILRAEGYRIILINSNPATIMTDPDIADVTYIEPILPHVVAEIIAKEKPDALLPTMGGQTALNCAKALAEDGTLEKAGVELIGANLESINKAEDRELFNDAMARIGLDVAKNGIARSMDEALKIMEEGGLPAIIRPSFTMGGSGGGIAYNHEEFEHIVASGLAASPTHEVLIDESLLGWKEYEMEVVRDHADNCIIICSIENIDPMGVHTGDSITVAPALTLTDKEYQRMRNASLAVLREIGVDTGGSNVQFAVNPDNGRMVVIEMNPRVSRSSALASKATGFPIAKVAAKLAVGYTLDEITNDVTRATPASFEPTIDYVVTKIPRFTFEKFPGTDQTLTTSMKSVGEAMAIGRNFCESLQKALCSLETGLTGLNDFALGEGDGEDPLTAIEVALGTPTPDRLLIVAQALRLGMSIEDIYRITKIDPWFLRQIRSIIAAEAQIIKNGIPQDKAGLLALKKLGFADARLAQLTQKPTSEINDLRVKLGVHPVFKRVDTCAAEFEALTPYLYSCYEGDGTNDAECEVNPSDREKILILGGGPNRIGQGIEFDYCCVHAAYALKELGYETIMVNCNPETVSTDYDTSDRLYFEPLTHETVMEIIRKEQKNGCVLGVIVQFGGQTPLKLAKALTENNIPILGTPFDAIDLAEDRKRFKRLLQDLNLKQPANEICYQVETALEEANNMGFPVVVRPSYVLGGRAMAIVHDATRLQNYLKEIEQMFGDGPILLDSYLSDAIEVDVDAVSDGHDVYVAGIMEHIEEAGIHSGDSACSLPPYSLSPAVVAEIHKQTIKLAKALGVVGLMNVQFAVQSGDVYIIEVNPRASRTVPFVAKATGLPIAKIATQVMAGQKLKSFDLSSGYDHTRSKTNHVAVKEAVFPFARFANVDVILGPEMKSTGEVMGIDVDFPQAFAKAHLASGSHIPTSGTVFVSVKDSDKKHVVAIGEKLHALGFSIIATHGTARLLNSHDIPATGINKVREGRPHIVDYMKDGKIDLVINTTEGQRSVSDSFGIRRTALLSNIPYCTTLSGSRALLQAIDVTKNGEGLQVHSLQTYCKQPK
ncbi:MAG: carbamoyl-phosphate synthase large subunit [Alphaproteobacteria bacterium]|nr:carbamoyl-phosphate synthase large subunit [Alphaproteobacteria bacterium]